MVFCVKHYVDVLFPEQPNHWYAWMMPHGMTMVMMMKKKETMTTMMMTTMVVVGMLNYGRLKTTATTNAHCCYSCRRVPDNWQCPAIAVVVTESILVLLLMLIIVMAAMMMMTTMIMMHWRSNMTLKMLEQLPMFCQERRQMFVLVIMKLLIIHLHYLLFQLTNAASS